MLVLHLLRTERFSRASRPALSVCALTAGGLIVLTALPLTPLGEAVDFTAPPAEYWIVLVCIVALYIIAAWAVKKIYVRRYGRLT